MGRDLTSENADRQDAAWYVNGGGSEGVWHKEGCDFYVARVGEMKILYTDTTTRHTHTFRYTEDIEGAGIYDDKELYDLGLDESILFWDNNAWFEVCSYTDLDYCSEPIDQLDEAIDYALELSSGKEQK